MSLDPIGDLRNKNRHEGEIVGYRIRTETARSLGINFNMDEKFKAITAGQNIAIIWDGRGFQWITFDTIDELTRNISDVNVNREQVIDDTSGDAIAENGAFFTFRPAGNNVICRTCKQEFRTNLQLGVTLTTRGFDSAKCPNGHMGADPLS